MRKVSPSEFDSQLERLLKKSPQVAREYARRFADLPLPAQLGIMRRRRWLSQQKLANKLKLKQPQVARLESGRCDPRLSSIQHQAQALCCHLLIVPDELLARIANLIAAYHP